MKQLCTVILNCLACAKSLMKMVGRRLDHASTLSYIEKHPIECQGLKIEKCLHQGRGVTVTTIRSSGFWILALVSSVASVIYRCITCRKLDRHALEQQLALLPSDRVEESPPFTFSVVDTFGPYSVFLNMVERFSAFRDIDSLSTVCGLYGVRGLFIPELVNYLIL